MPDNLTIADIQQAFLEYRADFKEANTALWYGEQQGQIVGAMLKALSPWNVGPQNVTWNQAAKNAGEILLTFGIPSFLTTVQIGVGGLTVSVANPDWAGAPSLLSVFHAALETLKRNSNSEIQTQQTTLGFHVKPTTRPFREILSRLVNVDALEGGNARMFGVSVYHKDHTFVIDSSAIFAESVFIKLIRSFPAEKTLDEMAATLQADEEKVLGRLGLKLQ